MTAAEVQDTDHCPAGTCASCPDSQHCAGLRAELRAAEPPIIEGPGRYRVYAAPDGGWVIARAVGICETCQNCGCGEQAEPVQIPAMVISLAQTQGKQRLMGMLKAVTGRG